MCLCPLLIVGAQAGFEWPSDRIAGGDQRFADHQRIDILDHAGDLAVSHLEQMGKRRVHRFAGGFVDARIDPESGDTVAIL